MEKPSDPRPHSGRRFPWLMLLALGPVTTRLVVLYRQNVRAGHFSLAAICLIGIVSFWYLAPSVFSHSLQSVGRSIHALNAHAPA